MVAGKSKFSFYRLLHISVMDRYIVGAILPPFFFGLGMFSALGIAVGILFDLVRRVTEYGLPNSIAFKVALFSVPQFILYSFPMSMLLAALMTYGQLSSDSEIVAMRSVGASVYRIVVPALALSLVITGVTFIFNDWIVPSANYQAAITLEKALNQDKPLFQDKNIFYPEYATVKDDFGNPEKILKRLFYAERFDGQEMQGLTVLDRSEGNVSQIVTSEAATWNFRENKWDFFNGVMYFMSPDGSIDNFLRFKRQQIQLPRTPLDLASRVRDNTELSIAQARSQMKFFQQAGDDRAVRKLRVRIQQKFSLPFACLVFGLVGAALGVLPRNTSKSTSFGLSVIVIFCYYTLFTVTGQMGVLGSLSPLVAAWLANIVGLTVGGILLLRSAS
ncbi:MULTISPECIES: LptF/LptG family permease [Spirulina sp. CCY15215]|uniref:LptF/LptG family permease n=1 Tax=Spirulina sp. CCY15215 TaxID=2767591 RepID=UPI00194FE6B2|nr:LptF/LptG family permease [Spirulina major]